MPNIVIIDNRDSFTFNVYQYVLMSGAQAHVIGCDDIAHERARIDAATGLILSPGPGAAQDATESLDILHAYHATKPIFGICLGHQIIGHYFGAITRPAKKIMHGKTSQVTHNAQGVFANLPPKFNVTRYHSLAVGPDNLPPDISITCTTEDDGEIMGLQHAYLPIFGVQFHPEAILTEHGQEIIDNFTHICGHS